jgi:hypothetical protein
MIEFGFRIIETEIRKSRINFKGLRLKPFFYPDRGYDTESIFIVCSRLWMRRSVQHYTDACSYRCGGETVMNDRIYPAVVVSESGFLFGITNRSAARTRFPQ